jgi:hypothetical protein
MVSLRRNIFGHIFDMWLEIKEKKIAKTNHRYRRFVKSRSEFVEHGNLNEWNINNKRCKLRWNKQ